MFFSVMARTPGASTIYRPGRLSYVSFTLDIYFHKYEYSLHTDLFEAMSSNGHVEEISDSWTVFDLDTALGAWSSSSASWGGRGAVRRNNDCRYVDMPFVRCAE